MFRPFVAWDCVPRGAYTPFSPLSPMSPTLSSNSLFFNFQSPSLSFNHSNSLKLFFLYATQRGWAPHNTLTTSSANTTRTTTLTFFFFFENTERSNYHLNLCLHHPLRMDCTEAQNHHYPWILVKVSLEIDLNHPSLCLWVKLWVYTCILVMIWRRNTSGEFFPRS